MRYEENDKERTIDTGEWTGKRMEKGTPKGKSRKERREGMGRRQKIGNRTTADIHF